MGIRPKLANLILLTIFWVVWKENNKAFNGCVRDIGKIRERWLHTFGSLILDHDVYGWGDFGRKY